MKIKDIEWKTEYRYLGDKKPDVLFIHNCEQGKLTVLDRMTGYGDGVRDIETGFLDKDKNWYLNAGNYDIRDYPELTIEEAIEKIKKDCQS